MCVCLLSGSALPYRAFLLVSETSEIVSLMPNYPAVTSLSFLIN